MLDHVYAVLRRRAELGWRIDRARGDVKFPEIERARMIARLALVEGWSADRISGAFDGGKYRPATLNHAERRLAKALEGQSLADPDHRLGEAGISRLVRAAPEARLRQAPRRGDEGGARPGRDRHPRQHAEDHPRGGDQGAEIRRDRGQADAALALGPARRGPTAAGRPRNLQERHHRGPGRRLAARGPDGRCTTGRARRRFLRRCRRQDAGPRRDDAEQGQAGRDRRAEGPHRALRDPHPPRRRQQCRAPRPRVRARPLGQAPCRPASTAC